MRRLTWRRVFLLLIVALLLAISLFIPHAGSWLVVTDPLIHAEVAVVLSGLPTSRAFAARDLYRQGLVEEIWVIPEPVTKVEGEMVTDKIFDELVRANLVNPSTTQWAQRILVSMGIPEDKIVVLPKPAHGTISEAYEVRDAFNGRLPKRLVIITSKSASRRAQMIFRRVFQHDGVEVLSYPTPYDPFEAIRWWSRPRNALTVVTEYEKLLVNILTLTIGSARR
ncbi:MAG: YdcF family protein [Candidatus Omnitrophica bacterium]|nr:YdcF family protein [Candidatus Omnitrophota bacterium]